MDLSTLTKLSRKQLDGVARLAGIAQPEAYTSAELIAVLLDKGRADVDRALQVATDAANTARDVFAALSQNPLMRRFMRTERLTPSASVPPPRPRATDEPSWRRPPTRAPETAVQPAPAAEPAAAPTPPQASEPPLSPFSAGPDAVDEPAVALPAPKPVPAQPSIAQLGQDVPSRSFEQEPIRTRSMARVLLAQGHRERAIALLEAIVAANPDDLAAREDLERAHHEEVPSETWVALPAPETTHKLPATGDTIAVRALPDRGIEITWSATEAGEARALAVLGSAGELAVRMVAISPDPERVVRSQITERGPVLRQQQWLAPPIAPGSRYFATIGVRAGDRFVAIAHAPARTVD